MEVENFYVKKSTHYQLKEVMKISLSYKQKIICFSNFNSPKINNEKSHKQTKHPNQNILCTHKKIYPLHPKELLTRVNLTFQHQDHSILEIRSYYTIGLVHTTPKRKTDFPAIDHDIASHPDFSGIK